MSQTLDGWMMRRPAQVCFQIATLGMVQMDSANGLTTKSLLQKNTSSKSDVDSPPSLP